MADTWSVPDVFAEIERQAPMFGVNPAYAKAIAAVENTADGKIKTNTWNRGAISPAGAAGLMQVMPDTVKGLQKAGLLPPDWKYDPNNLSSQVSAGLAAMKDVMGQMKNPDDPYELAAGYNGSPAVRKSYQAGNFSNLPAETRQYFTKLRTALMDQGITAPSSPANNSQGSTLTNLGQPLSNTPANSGSDRSMTGASSGTSSSRKVGDPELLSQLLMDGFSIVKPGGSLDQTASGVSSSAVARNEAVTGLLSAILAKSKAAGEAVMASTAQDAGEAARRALILRSTNLDPGAVGNLMDRTMQTINSTDEQLRSMKPEIDRRMAVGFFDNPLEWLVNQVRLPGMVAEYNGIATTQNAAIDTFKNAATIAGTEQTLAKGIDADAIVRTGTAKAAQAAADAQAELAKTQIEAATANSRDYLTLAHIASERLGADLKLFGATAVTETERKGESERAANARAEQENLDNINRLITAAGGNGISLVQFKTMSAKEREELVQRASTGKFGKNFSESFDFQDTLGNRRELANKGGLASVLWMDGTQQEAMKIVQDDAAKWTKMNPGKLMTSKQKEELMRGALDQVQTRYEHQYQKDMRLADSSNPYRLQYSTWAKAPEMANNPLAIFINKYGPDSSEAVFKDIDEKYLLDRFSVSVQRGTMSAGDAAKAISDFYKFGMQKQAMATSYPLYGLTPATQYVVDIPKNGIFSGNAPIVAGSVDMADPKKVENYLTRNVAMRSVQENLVNQQINPLGYSSKTIKAMSNAGKVQ